MKNTVRVHKHSATKGPEIQPQTAPAQPQAPIEDQFRLPQDAPHHACLVIFDREHQQPVTKVPLTEDEFHRFWAAALQESSLTKKYPAEAFADAIRLAGTAEHYSQKMCNQAEEMRQAMLRADVLLVQLTNQITELSTQLLSCKPVRSTSEGGMLSDNFNFGLCLLADDLRETLKRKTKEMMTAAYEKN